MLITNPITFDNGDRRWLYNGQYHREDGPACEYADGDQYWYHHGSLRRIKRIDNGFDQYWLNGQLHREDGPAMTYEGKQEWWYQGIKLPCSTQQEFEDLLQLKLFW